MAKQPLGPIDVNAVMQQILGGVSPPQAQPQANPANLGVKALLEELLKVNRDVLVEMKKSEKYVEKVAEVIKKLNDTATKEANPNKKSKDHNKVQKNDPNNKLKNAYNKNKPRNYDGQSTGRERSSKSDPIGKKKLNFESGNQLFVGNESLMEGLVTNLKYAAEQLVNLNTGYRGLLGTVLEGVGAQVKYTQEVRAALYETGNVTSANQTLFKTLEDLENITKVTGASQENAQENLVKYIKAGVRLDGNAVKYKEKLVNLTEAQLSTEKQLGLEAGDLFDTFNHLYQVGRLTEGELADVGRGMRDIAKQTGLTGKNLQQAMSSSQSIIDVMRKASTLTATAVKNVTQGIAAAEKLGVTEQTKTLLEAASSTTNLFFTASNQTKSLLFSAAASVGKVGDLQKGVLTRSKEGIKALAEGVTNVLKRFGVESMDAIDNLSDSAKMKLNLNLKAAFGLELGEVRGVVESLTEAGKGYGDRVADIEKRLKTNLTLEEKTSALEEKRRLATNQSLETLTVLDKAAVGAKNMDEALSKFGERRKEFEKDLQSLGLKGTNKEVIRGALQEAIKGIETATKKNLGITSSEIEKALDNPASFRELTAKLSKAETTNATKQKTQLDALTETNQYLQEIKTEIMKGTSGTISAFMSSAGVLGVIATSVAIIAASSYAKNGFGKGAGKGATTAASTAADNLKTTPTTRVSKKSGNMPAKKISAASANPPKGGVINGGAFKGYAGNFAVGLGGLLIAAGIIFGAMMVLQAVGIDINEEKIIAITKKIGILFAATLFLSTEILAFSLILKTMNTMMSVFGKGNLARLTQAGVMFVGLSVGLGVLGAGLVYLSRLVDAIGIDEQEIIDSTKKLSILFASVGLISLVMIAAAAPMTALGYGVIATGGTLLGAIAAGAGTLIVLSGVLLLLAWGIQGLSNVTSSLDIPLIEKTSSELSSIFYTIASFSMAIATAGTAVLAGFAGGLLGTIAVGLDKIISLLPGFGVADSISRMVEWIGEVGKSGVDAISKMPVSPSELIKAVDSLSAILGPGAKLIGYVAAAAAGLAGVSVGGLVGGVAVGIGKGIGWVMQLFTGGDNMASPIAAIKAVIDSLFSVLSEVPQVIKNLESKYRISPEIIKQSATTLEKYSESPKGLGKAIKAIADEAIALAPGYQSLKTASNSIGQADTPEVVAGHLENCFAVIAGLAIASPKLMSSLQNIDPSNFKKLNEFVNAFSSTALPLFNGLASLDQIVNSSSFDTIEKAQASFAKAAKIIENVKSSITSVIIATATISHEMYETTKNIPLAKVKESLDLVKSMADIFSEFTGNSSEFGKNLNTKNLQELNKSLGNDNLPKVLDNVFKNVEASLNVTRKYKISNIDLKSTASKIEQIAVLTKAVASSAESMKQINSLMAGIDKQDALKPIKIEPKKENKNTVHGMDMTPYMKQKPLPVIKPVETKEVGTKQIESNLTKFYENILNNSKALIEISKKYKDVNVVSIGPVTAMAENLGKLMNSLKTLINIFNNDIAGPMKEFEKSKEMLMMGEYTKTTTTSYPLWWDKVEKKEFSKEQSDLVQNFSLLFKNLIAINNIINSEIGKLVGMNPDKSNSLDKVYEKLAIISKNFQKVGEFFTSFQKDIMPSLDFVEKNKAMFATQYYSNVVDEAGEKIGFSDASNNIWKVLVTLMYINRDLNVAFDTLFQEDTGKDASGKISGVGDKLMLVSKNFQKVGEFFTLFQKEIMPSINFVTENKAMFARKSYDDGEAFSEASNNTWRALKTIIYMNRDLNVAITELTTEAGGEDASGKISKLGDKLMLVTKSMSSFKDLITIFDANFLQTIKNFKPIELADLENIKKSIQTSIANIKSSILDDSFFSEIEGFIGGIPNIPKLDFTSFIAFSKAISTVINQFTSCFAFLNEAKQEVAKTEQVYPSNSSQTSTPVAAIEKKLPTIAENITAIRKFFDGDFVPLLTKFSEIVSGFKKINISEKDFTQATKILGGYGTIIREVSSLLETMGIIASNLNDEIVTIDSQGIKKTVSVANYLKDILSDKGTSDFGQIMSSLPSFIIKNLIEPFSKSTININPKKVERIAKILKSTSEAISALTSLFTILGTDLDPATIKAASTQIGKLKEVGPNVITVYGELKNSGPVNYLIADFIIALIQNVIEPLSILNKVTNPKKLTKTAAILKSVSSIAMDLPGLITNVNDCIGKLMKVDNNNLSFIQDVSAKLEEFGEQLPEFVVSLYNNFIIPLGAIPISSKSLDKIAKKITSIATIVNALPSLIENLSTKLPDLMKNLESVDASLGAKLGAKGESFRTVFIGLLSFIMQGVVAPLLMVSASPKLLAKASSQISSLATLCSNLGPIFIGFFNSMEELLDYIDTKYGSDASEKISQLAEIFNNDFFKGTFVSISDGTIQNLEKLLSLEKLIDQIKSFDVSALTDIFKDVDTNAINADPLENAMINLGLQLDGIINTMQDNINKLIMNEMPAFDVSALTNIFKDIDIEAISLSPLESALTNFGEQLDKILQLMTENVSKINEINSLGNIKVNNGEVSTATNAEMPENKSTDMFSQNLQMQESSKPSTENIDELSELTDINGEINGKQTDIINVLGNILKALNISLPSRNNADQSPFDQNNSLDDYTGKFSAKLQTGTMNRSDYIKGNNTIAPATGGFSLG